MSNIEQTIKYIESGQLEQAEAILSNETAKTAEYYWAMGLLKGSQSQYQQALDNLLKATEINPCFLPVYDNLVPLFNYFQDADKALSFYRQQLTIIEQVELPEEKKADLYCSLGLALALFNDHQDAQTYLEKAVNINPHSAKYQSIQCLNLLALGKVKEGFSLLDWCYGMPQLPINHPKEKLWDGSSLEGKTILLHSDQGYGDAIMFARYLPMVKQLTDKVVLSVPSALTKIMETLPEVGLIVTGDDHFLKYDVHCPLMLLSKFFETSRETIPCDVPYLSVNVTSPIDISDVKDFKIGLIWAGNPKHKNDYNRSCPLVELEPLLSLSKTKFYSLQMGQSAWDLRYLKNPALMTPVSEKITNFADMAAFISQLDLVITVDTAMAHLCGALNLPAWVMLPFAPEWRWQLEKDTSPWYPSLKLYKQARLRDWQSVVWQMHQALIKIIANT